MSMNDFESTVNDILSHFQRKSDRAENAPGSIATLHALIGSLEKCTMHLPGLQNFMSSVRNLFVAADTTKRALMLRAVRLCMHSASCVKMLISDELHWLVVESLERDSEYTVERIQ